MTIAEREFVEREPDAGTGAQAIDPALSWLDPTRISGSSALHGRDTFARDDGLTSPLGIGGVFVIGVATLLIGVVLVAVWNARAPAFFRGETFTPEWAARHEPELVRD